VEYEQSLINIRTGTFPIVPVMNAKPAFGVPGFAFITGAALAETRVLGLLF
jgi:hypothetical protein